MKADTDRLRCRNAGEYGGGPASPDAAGRKDQKSQIAPVLISQLSFRICRRTSYLVCNDPASVFTLGHFQIYLLLFRNLLPKLKSLKMFLRGKLEGNSKKAGFSKGERHLIISGMRRPCSQLFTLMICPVFSCQSCGKGFLRGQGLR